MRTIAAGIRGGVPAYDPQHPHYDLTVYISRQSFFDHESIETEESMADNFNSKKTIWDAKNAEPSRVPFGQDDDGYACELYTL